MPAPPSDWRPLTGGDQALTSRNCPFGSKKVDVALASERVGGLSVDGHLRVIAERDAGHPEPRHDLVKSALRHPKRQVAALKLRRLVQEQTEMTAELGAAELAIGTVRL